MRLDPQHTMAQHRHHVERARALIAFVEKNVFMLPDWNRVARAATACGLFSGKTKACSTAMTLMHAWRKRRYWLSRDVETRWESGSMLPKEVRVKVTQS